MILAIQTQKGGVGKTTTALNLGAALAKYGKVLVVDMEPQADLTDYAGAGLFVPPLDMTDVITGRTSIENVILKGARYDIAVNTKKMKAEALTYTGRLAKELEKIESKYDYIIIDTPPAISVQTVEALNAANVVIIPAQLQRGAVRAVAEDLEALRSISRTNKDLYNYYVLPTMYNARTRGQARYLQEIQTDYNGHILPYVRQCQQIADSQEQAADIFASFPASHGATDYREIAETLHNILTSK